MSAQDRKTHVMSSTYLDPIDWHLIWSQILVAPLDIVWSGFQIVTERQLVVQCGAPLYSIV